MKKIYQIPKGQLIVIIVFGLIGELITLIGTGECYGDCGILGFLAIFIPFLLTFYLVGWIHFNKRGKTTTEHKYNLSNEIKDNSLKFCSICGKKNTLGSKYCIECGELIIN